MATSTIADLLIEYDRALAYTEELWADLSSAELQWRAGENASAIGWHLGHQPAVAHYLVRNLTAAEPPIDAELDSLMDSATPEQARGIVPDRATLAGYREAVAERLRFRMGNIESGDVGAPAQLRVIAKTLLVAVINHEYQHDRWIGEVRSGVHGKELPPEPTSDHLTTVDGYLIVQ
jgi:hypothetical protein